MSSRYEDVQVLHTQFPQHRERTEALTERLNRLVAMGVLRDWKVEREVRNGRQRGLRWAWFVSRVCFWPPVDEQYHHWYSTGRTERAVDYMEGFVTTATARRVAAR